jgi:hypothetical protein
MQCSCEIQSWMLNGNWRTWIESSLQGYLEMKNKNMCYGSLLYSETFKCWKGNWKTNLKENLLINKQLRDIFKRWFTCSFIHVLQVVACPQYLFVNKKVKLNVKWEQGL